MKQLRALLIEPNEEAGAALRSRLEQAGLEVRVASTLTEALALAEDTSAFDVTVTGTHLFNAQTARLAASLEELQRQRTSVLHLNQLKNDLIAVLAHDIKGPLTSIVGFAELLEEGYLEGNAATDAARTIRSNAQRLATLANDVLALSRVEHGELEIADERVDLIKLVSEAIDLHTAERTVECVHEVAEAYVRGDAERLRQVFDNLLRNAIKYSPGGQPVRVEIARRDTNWVVSFIDLGIGIPEEEAGRLFDRFSRGSNARRAKISGTGIGLFIVKMIVERHGGTVCVASTLGEGSRFDVALPAIESSAALRPIRVTLLTSDRGLSRFAAYELRTRGYRVREAATLEDVANAAVRGGDVIVVDDGVATAAAVREAIGAERDVRLIALGHARSDGWSATLAKPFLVEDLLRAIGTPPDHLVCA